jgi:hypothetical protein
MLSGAALGNASWSSGMACKSYIDCKLGYTLQAFATVAEIIRLDTTLDFCTLSLLANTATGKKRDARILEVRWGL